MHWERVASSVYCRAVTGYRLHIKADRVCRLSLPKFLGLPLSFACATCRNRGGPRILERGGPTMEDSEMSRQSRRGGAEGVAGGECGRGLNPLWLGGSGPPENFQPFGAFSCKSRHSSALWPGLLIQAY